MAQTLLKESRHFSTHIAGIIMHKRIIVASLFAAFASLPSVSMAQAAPAASPWSLSGNLTIGSEYIYRGIAQTNRKPTVQGGFDAAHSSGFYVGNWNSNVSWLSDPGGVSNSIEMDVYGGYKGTLGGSVGYDVGALYYYYPGSYPAGFVSPNTTELYGALSFGPVTVKYSHSTSNLFGFATSKNSGYLDVTGNFDLGNGFTATAHVGHQKIKNNGNFDYTDYRLALSKDVGGFMLTAAAIGTNADAAFYTNAFGKDLGKSRLVLSVGKTF